MSFQTAALLGELCQKVNLLGCNIYFEFNNNQQQFFYSAWLSKEGKFEVIVVDQSAHS